VRHLRDVCTVIVRKVMKGQLIFDSAKSGLLLSEVPKRRLPGICGPRRLARPRTSPFHGGNTGSNPVGDANLINHLRNCRFWHTTGYATVKLLDHSTMGITLLFRHSFVVHIHRD
jgi:hypothetical protein